VENFKIRLVGQQSLLGRVVRGVSLTPKAKAGPRLVLWVDPETGIVLHRRQSNHRGSLLRESRLVALEVGAAQDKSLFSMETTADGMLVQEQARPELESPGQLAAKGFPARLWQERLPFGFHLDSARMVQVGEAEILHFRYTNGLTLLSLFLSPYAIESSDIPSDEEADEIEDFAAVSWAGSIHSWEEAERHYVLVGDLSQASLRQVRSALDEAQPGS